MIDYDILAEFGTTNERLRQFFTAKAPTEAQAAKLTPAETKARERDIKLRDKYEARVSSILNEAITFTLQNHHFWGAVDLAWDSTPIQQQILPLILYAQGRIDLTRATAALKELPEGDTYVKRNAKGEVVGIDLPKFTEVQINLIRSIVTRRTASLTNRYNNLWPHFKYESRGGSQVAKLRSEAVSQRMDIMADQYDYRHLQTQVIRDMYLYTNVVTFPRSAWEQEVQLVKDNLAPEFAGKKPRIKSQVVKEGVAFVQPHPSRVFYDTAHALSSINTDNGCEWLGFWDVQRFGDIGSNTKYFNRDRITFSDATTEWMLAYGAYFDQYYDNDTITPPKLPESPVATNDRKTRVGLYASEQEDAACFLTHLYMKEIPKRWGWGKYAHPVWIHLVVAGDATVVGAEIMPSAPASVASYNCKDDRLLNASLAHELMPFQDQLTNLFSQLLETIKADLFSVALLNTDLFQDSPESKKVLEEFQKTMSGRNWYASTQVLECSFAKLAQLGIAATSENIFKIVRGTPHTEITRIFEAIVQTIGMAERMANLSSQEQGQPAPREITAHEVRSIAGTTEAIHNFGADAVDEWRAATKRICYESTIALGSDDVELTVLNRYPRKIIERAGFAMVDEDGDGDLDTIDQRVPLEPRYRITGKKSCLVHDYIFTSRDGAERGSNPEAAKVLVELIGRQAQLSPEVQRALMQAMGKEKIFELWNEVFRLADASVDLKLELQPGDDNNLLPEEGQSMQILIQRLAQAVSKNTQDVNAIKQVLMQMQQQQSVIGKQSSEETNANLGRIATAVQRNTEDISAMSQPAGMAIPPTNTTTI
jgi:hypothetical protein